MGHLLTPCLNSCNEPSALITSQGREKEREKSKSERGDETGRKDEVLTLYVCFGEWSFLLEWK